MLAAHVLSSRCRLYECGLGGRAVLRLALLLPASSAPLLLLLRSTRGPVVAAVVSASHSCSRYCSAAARLSKAVCSAAGVCCQPAAAELCALSFATPASLAVAVLLSSSLSSGPLALLPLPLPPLLRGRGKCSDASAAAWSASAAAAASVRCAIGAV
jgi:hypothetical protein